MTMKKCLPLFLILASLFLASVAQGRGEFDLENPEVDPRREFEECERKCQEQQPRGQQRQLCEQRCVQRRRQREESERRHGDDADADLTEYYNPQERPEQKYQQCKSDCQKSHRSAEHQQACQRQCLQQYEEDVRREKEEREHGRGGRNPHGKDPELKFKECQLRCQREPGQEKRECIQECERKYREDQGRRRRGITIDEENPMRESEWPEEETSRRTTTNPYHFSSQRMQSKFKTDEGHLKVLEKLSIRSKLLKGLENYRIVVLEAAPNTFVVPHHCDADTLLVVTKGKGTISIVRQNNKESYNMECADVVMARAGSTVYIVNQDNTQRLQITKLASPVNVPGQFEEYYPAGGEIPNSYFKAFSSNILKQSLSASEEQIEKLIGEQGGRRQGRRQGVILRASQEQLKALSQHATSPRRKGGRRESSGPISLQNMSPLYSNNHGKFFEADPNDYKQLEEMDVFVNWAELKQGSIMVPHYNSKATVLVKVVEGTGRIEMACPHLARERRQSQERWGREEEQQQQQEEQTGTSIGQYETVTAHLSPGDVFIIPAGHPIAIVASEGQTLKMVGFGVNAQYNERTFIAGKDNMIKQLEREAKELAFNMPGREVEQIFNQPKLSYFVPQQSQEEGHRTHPLDSILNFAGFA